MRSLLQLNEEIKADARIQIAKISGFVIFLVSAVMTMMSSVGAVYATYCVLAYLGIYLVTLAGFFVVRKDNIALLLYALLSSYIWVAYVLKFSMIPFTAPEFFLGINASTDVDLYFRSVIPKFLVLCPALALFIIGLCIGPATKANLKGKSLRLPGSVNYILLYLSVSGIVLLKLVGQVFFDVGSPTKMGHGLPPLVLALYEFIVQDATIVLLNVLFFTLIYLRIKRGIILVSVALIANVILTLSAGWKSAMVLQALVLSYLFFELRHRVSKRTQRRVLVLAALFMGLMVVVYPYVNYYRFASAKGVDIQTAISEARESAQKNDGKEQGGGLFKLFDRVDGINTYVTIIGLGENKEFPLSSLWGNGFGNMVKYQLYGASADDAMVQFSATQFGAMYLVGGWSGLYFGSLIMGIIFRLMTSLLANRVIRYATTFHAYLPFLCFAWLTVLMGGGRIGFTLKELLVVVVSVVILERMVFRAKRAQKPSQPGALSGDDKKIQSRILRPASPAGPSSDGAV